MNEFLDLVVLWMVWTAAWWAALAAGVAVWFRFWPPHSTSVRHAVLAVAILAGTLAGLVPRWGDGVVSLRQGDASPYISSKNAPAVESTAVIDNLSRDVTSNVGDPAPGVKESPQSLPASADPLRVAIPQSVVVPESRDVQLSNWLRDSVSAGKYVFVTVWAIGALYLSIRLVRAVRVTVRWRREAIPLPDDERALFVELKNGLGVHRQANAGLHPETATPVVLCGWPAMVLVPIDWPTWKTESRVAAWRHELDHVHRCDDLWRILSEGLRVTFWFHPGVRWLLARREQEAEMLSDEAAVAAGCPPQELAQVLIDACRRPHTHTWNAPAGTFFSRKTMKMRISRLMDAASTEVFCRPAPRWLWIATVGAVSVLTMAGSMRWVTAVDTPPEIPANTPPEAGTYTPPEPVTDVRKLERKIGKEPEYQGKPIYCLLAFGEKLEPRWLVLDVVNEPSVRGTTPDVAYFDRDGDGDLTKPTNRIVSTENKATGTSVPLTPDPLAHFETQFDIGDVVLADGTKHTDFKVELGNYVQDYRSVAFGLKLRGKHDQFVGHGSTKSLLRFGDAPVDAPVVHLDGPLRIRPVWSNGKLYIPTNPFPPETPESREWYKKHPPGYEWATICPGKKFVIQAELGTEGGGHGTFAKLSNVVPPEYVHPIANLRLPGGKTLNVLLKTRCCTTIFCEEVLIPDDVSIGEAEISISYRDWAARKVRTFNGHVDVHHGVEAPHVGADSLQTAPTNKRDQPNASEPATKVVPVTKVPTEVSGAGQANSKEDTVWGRERYLKVIGQIVDDETGRPIETCVWEHGSPNPDKPGDVLWGYRRGNETHLDGRFEVSVWISKQGVYDRIRVLVAGYEPAVVVGELPESATDTIERIVRLKRTGEMVSGAVVDYQNKPVAGAKIFFIPEGHTSNIIEGQSGADYTALPVARDHESAPIRIDRTSRDGNVAETVADAEGRFKMPIAGAGTLAVSTDQIDLWPFPLPAKGEPANLKLPEPAKLVIELDEWHLDGMFRQPVEPRLYASDGDPRECWLHITGTPLRPTDDETMNERLYRAWHYERPMLVLGPEKDPRITRGIRTLERLETSKMELIPGFGANTRLQAKIQILLPPGNYNLDRAKLGARKTETYNITLKPGEVQVFDRWKRTEGAAVRGVVKLPLKTRFVPQPGARSYELNWSLARWGYVSIRSREIRAAEYAMIDQEGRFAVPSHLPPGRYWIQAFAILPDGDRNSERSGSLVDDLPVPDLEHVLEELEIPEPPKNAAGPPPVEVELLMKAVSSRIVPDFP